jgi:hypothetical protein
MCNIYLQCIFAIYICNTYLQYIFAIYICNIYLQYIFAIYICNQYLQSIFAINICNQYLQHMLATDICKRRFYLGARCCCATSFCCFSVFLLTFFTSGRQLGVRTGYVPYFCYFICAPFLLGAIQLVILNAESLRRVLFPHAPVKREREKERKRGRERER